MKRLSFVLLLVIAFLPSCGAKKNGEPCTVPAPGQQSECISGICHKNNCAQKCEFTIDCEMRGGGVCVQTGIHGKLCLRPCSFEAMDCPKGLNCMNWKPMNGTYLGGVYGCTEEDDDCFCYSPR